MSTTLSPTSSNSSCSATAISPSAYYNNSYLPFNPSAVVNDSSSAAAAAAARTSAASSYFNDSAAGEQQQSHQLSGHLPGNQYLENYSNSLISNHHNSPSLSSASPSSVSTFTNLHNHFGAHSVNGTTAGGAHHLSAAHSLHHSNHLSSHPTQPELTNHSSLSNSISNSLSNSSVMHHLNNQNSSFTFNHPHQANPQINLSSFNHLHHHSNHNLDAADLSGGSAALAAPNPMSFYINNSDAMLSNTNSLTSLTNLTGLQANASPINNANPLAWNANIDYFGKTMDTFINSTNKFNKTIERGEWSASSRQSILVSDW